MNSWKPVSNFVKSTTKGITPRYVDHSSIIVLNQKCIRNNRIDYSFAQFTDDSNDISEVKFVKKGDILVNSTGAGTAGRCAFVPELPQHHRLIVDSHILILRCGSFSEAQCLSYNLFSFEKTLMSFLTGSSGQSELDKVVLLNLKTKMPSNSLTQQKIASVLSSLDSKIELNNRINRELEQMAKLLYDYWFVQFEFPCPTLRQPFDGAQGNGSENGGAVPELVEGKPYKTSGGKMVWNAELKREIPEGWKVKDLSEVTSSIMRGISPKYLDEGGICVLNQKCIRDQEIKFEFGRRHDHELKSASSKLIQYGDVLVNSTGFGTLGRVAIVKWLQEQITAIDSHITIVRGDSKNIKKLFLGYSMLGRQTEIEGLAEGSTGQTELSRVNLGQLKMVIPPIELQSRFEKFAEPLIQKMAVNESENQQLASLRDWLLPMLMNGQVTVGAKEKVNYEVTEGLDVAAEPNR